MSRKTKILLAILVSFVVWLFVLDKCGIMARGDSLTSIDAHYSDGSKISTTAPSVLAAAGNAIAATQPVPATKPVVVVTPPVTKPTTITVTPPAAAVTQITTAGGLNAVKWTGNRELVLNGSGTFDLSQQTIALGTLIYIHSADPKHPATISIPGNSTYTLSVNGSIKIADCKIVGGKNAVLVQTHGQGNADLENLSGDACCLFWGEGGNIVSVLNCSVPGEPNQYAICNFDATLTNLHINGCTFSQGPNQGAIRQMEVWQSLVENSTFIGSDFKQCIQDRSTGDDPKSPGHVWKNVTVKCTPGHGYTADIGPMTWQDYSNAANTPQPLTLSQWINCTLPDYPSVERPGGKKTVQRILYQTCTMGGDKNVNKDFN